MPYIYLFISIVSEVLATSFLKASEGFSKPFPSAMVVLGYATAFYFLSLTLRALPVGVAYAIWSGVGIVLVSLVGYFYYGQKLDAAAIVGMTLIGAGVILINFFSRSVGH